MVAVIRPRFSSSAATQVPKATHTATIGCPAETAMMLVSAIGSQWAIARRAAEGWSRSVNASAATRAAM